jgi:glycosyltransferase involved in cell wall biosynthesis
MEHKQQSKKILFLLSGLAIGGSEKKTVNTANDLTGRGFDVTVAYLGKPYDLKGLISDDVTKLDLTRCYKFDVKPIVKLRRYILSHGVGVVWGVNNLSMLVSYLSTIYLKGVKVIGSTNSTGYQNNKQYLLAKYLYSNIMLKLDRVVFGSETQKNEYATLINCHPAESMVLYNGVDIDYFSVDRLSNLEEVMAKYGISYTDYVVGTVAALRPEKNIDGLIKMFVLLKKKILNAKLLIVGDGLLMSELKHLASENGLTNEVIFVGSVTDVRPYHGIMDVFVLNSTVVETFSNAALEAMSMSLPVVLTDVGGAREMIVNGESGLLVDSGNERELLQALIKLEDSSRRKEFSLAARSRVASVYSSDKAISEYIKIISS